MGDYIKLDDAVDLIHRYYKFIGKGIGGIERFEIESNRITLEKAMLSIPPADVVERKRGEWIDEPNCFCRCSECGSHFASFNTSLELDKRWRMRYRYCPTCGADMRGENDDSH